MDDGAVEGGPECPKFWILSTGLRVGREVLERGLGR